MKIESANFITSATDLDSCPETNLPEFAFVGRSNVGKSSLINCLTGRDELARTSSKPGMTRLINFFRIQDAWILVDLPGYGFAHVSKEKRYEFNLAVSGYLTGRETLKQVFLLIDSKLEPMEGDLAFAEWLQECNVPYSVIFTKTDRSSDSRVDDLAQLFSDELTARNLRPTGTFRCSAKTGRGRNQILQWINGQVPKKQKTKGPTLNLGWMKR